MIYYLVKIAITVGLIVVISEVAKRNSYAAALLASIPLISVLAMLWLYIETGDTAKVSALATSVFWLVLPSLALFVSLPLLLQAGVNFYASLSISLLITVMCYWVMLQVLSYFGVKL